MRVCLQAHQEIADFSATSTLSGERPLPMCEPSQNGCRTERPHWHHQYVPGSTSSLIGPYWATTFSLTVSPP